MLIEIGLVTVGLLVGAIAGCMAAYRYKRQYESALRQLANLRGENYGGQLSTIGLANSLPRTESTAAVATVNRSEYDALGVRCVELENRVASLEQELIQAQQSSDDRDTSPSTGTEEWQLAQLHREQIAMQIKLDEHVATINALQEENRALRERLGE